MEKKRLVYFDIMRIISILCMITLHVSGNKIGLIPVESYNWKILNIYRSTVSFCVPLFIMISGALFLNPVKGIPIKSLYKKNVFRLLIAYIFWSVCYSFYTSGIYRGITSSTLNSFVGRVLVGHYHLWFIPMIIGLYIIVPFLRKITVEKKLTEYFLLLSFVFTIVFPIISLLPINQKVISIFERILDNAGINFLLGYSIYFVSGYYFSKYDLTTKIKVTIYTLGIACLVCTIITTQLISSSRNVAYTNLYGFLMPNTALMTLSTYIFLKNSFVKVNCSEKQLQMVSIFSRCSFGIYLIHDFFLILSRKLGFDALTFNPIFSVPLITLLVYFCSFTITFLISKIPKINKYIV